MRKILFALVVVLGVIAIASYGFADATTHKFKVVTADEVVSSQGCTVFKVSGYANSANSTFGLYNTNQIYNTSNTNVKIEGGEASQYDGLPYMDFGDEGIPFDSGLTVIVDGAYVCVEYE